MCMYPMATTFPCVHKAIYMLPTESNHQSEYWIKTSVTEILVHLCIHYMPIFSYLVRAWPDSDLSDGRVVIVYIKLNMDIAFL